MSEKIIYPVHATNSDNISAVLRSMADQCESERGYFASVYAHKIDILLDNLLDQDFFGEEGQLDPRGDHRN